MLKKIIAIMMILLSLFSSTQSAFAYELKGNYYEAYMKKVSQARKYRVENASTLNEMKINQNTVDTAHPKAAIASMYLKQSIPSIMYHKITDNPAEVTDFVVTGEMLKADFKVMKAMGFTPIFASEYFAMKELADNSADPEVQKQITEFFKKNPKPIIITFDDGYEGIYTHALPLMKEYGFKVNFYICGRLVDVNNPEYCTWEEIKELAESGLAEIGNHTYALHAKSKEDLINFYEYNLDGALEDYNLNRNIMYENTGIYSNIVSFPYGAYSTSLYDKLKEAGYTGFISTDYRVNFLTDKQITLGRYNRPASYETRDFFSLL